MKGHIAIVQDEIPRIRETPNLSLNAVRWNKLLMVSCICSSPGILSEDRERAHVNT
jgi:hypothetical protein